MESKEHPWQDCDSILDQLAQSGVGREALVLCEQGWRIEGLIGYRNYRSFIPHPRG